MCSSPAKDALEPFPPTIPWDCVRWSDAAHLALPTPRAGDVTDAYGLSPLELTPSRVGDWVGARSKGSSVNAYDAQLSIHGAGTHTECAAHISDLALSIADVAPLGLLVARLLDVPPTRIGRDQVIASQHLQDAWSMDDATRADIGRPTAAIIRSRPADAVPHRRWSGTHPPYFEPDALRFLVSQGIEHLVTDLPSVDPEQDGGKLLAHREFFAFEGGDRQRAQRATITELAWIPASLPAGLGILRLDVLAWPTDAAPSRPVFYPLSPFQADKHVI